MTCSGSKTEMLAMACPMTSLRTSAPFPSNHAPKTHTPDNEQANTQSAKHNHKGKRSQRFKNLIKKAVAAVLPKPHLQDSQAPDRPLDKSAPLPAQETYAEALASHQARVKAEKTAHPEEYYIYETFSEALEHFDSIAPPLPTSSSSPSSSRRSSKASWRSSSKPTVSPTSSPRKSSKSSTHPPSWANVFSRWGHLRPRPRSSSSSSAWKHISHTRPPSIDLGDISTALRVYETRTADALTAGRDSSLSNNTAEVSACSSVYSGCVSGGERESFEKESESDCRQNSKSDSLVHLDPFCARDIVVPVPDSEVSSLCSLKPKWASADEEMEFWGWGEKRGD